MMYLSLFFCMPFALLRLHARFRVFLSIEPHAIVCIPTIPLFYLNRRWATAGH